MINYVVVVLIKNFQIHLYHAYPLLLIFQIINFNYLIIIHKNVVMEQTCLLQSVQVTSAVFSLVLFQYTAQDSPVVTNYALLPMNEVSLITPVETLDTLDLDFFQSNSL